MKKQAFFLACMLTVTFVTMQAQINSAAPPEKSNTTNKHAAKKPFSKSILTKFREDFPSATNDAWANTENGYLVNFKVTDIQYTVFLDKNGSITSQIRFYREEHLPKAIRNQVKDYYGCYTIRSVKEITTNNVIVYLVTIEDNLIWKIVRVVGPEMDVLAEYNKG